MQEIAITVAFEQMEAQVPWRAGFTTEGGEPTQVVLAAVGSFRRESVRIERLGYVLEGPVRTEPYTEITLTRIRPSAWRSLSGASH